MSTVEYQVKHDPLGDGVSVVELIAAMGDDASVVRAARVSFANEGAVFEAERDEKLIRYLARNKHMTPFEHTSVTFHVAAPIFVVRQWQRHRAFSFNELSRRYTSEDIEVYVPPSWRGQSESSRQVSDGLVDGQDVVEEMYEESIGLALEHYDTMIKMGVAREQARMVLPQSLYARMYVTGNLRSFAHFHGLRADEHAQPEIQKYAFAIGSILGELYPVSWAALTGAG